MLLLCALIVGSSSAWAEADVTYDFTGSDWSVSNGTLTNGTVSFTGEGEANFKMNGGYFMMGKSGAYINFPKYNSPVEKIVVTGRSGASTGVIQNIFVGETAVSTATTGATGSNTYNIASGYQTAGTAYTLKVTSNHNTQITKIEIFYASGSGGVATPIFDPVGGSYTSAQNVEISCVTAGASIYYTTDGTTPTNESTPYTSAISVTTSGTTLKAIAYKGEDNSSVASATYTIKPTTPTITAAGATVTITGDEGCTFYYTTNGSDPNNESTEYSGPFDLTTSCTIKAIAYDAYNNASDVKSYTFKYFPLNPKNINSGYFEKVTDADDLENGDAILIVYETDEMAMSTNQKSSNRGEASVTISDDKVIYAPSEDVQKLVLVNQTEEISGVNTNVFYFYTGAGYLYASSGSSNQLKTEETPDNNNNARATISISDGNAKILFTGKNARNWLKYNPNGTNDGLFACYADNDTQQKIVQIYKEVAHNESATITSAEYATYCNATYALDFSGTGITAYTATEGETSVKLNEITSGKVPAETPVVLYKEGADGTAINVPVIASADAIEGTNDLHVSEGAAYSNSYVLAKPEGKKVGFYLWDSNVVLNAGKVYLKAGDSSRSFLGFEEGNTTSIDVRSKMEDVRGEVYNLNGQRVAQPTKGLYIVNGKKVVVK